jgi:D-alanyl-D-alanine carboxypeptidase
MFRKRLPPALRLCCSPVMIRLLQSSLRKHERFFEGLQHGTVDRSLFTDNANFYFNEQALKDFASGLGPFGIPEEFVQDDQRLRGGMKLHEYTIKFPKAKLSVWTYEMPDGKLEQYQIAAQD